MKLNRWVVILGSLLLMSGCNLCSDTIKSGSVSQDNALKATVFIRDCGATTDFSTIVSLHRPNSGYRDEANFIFVAKGEHPLHVEWNNSHKLILECASCQRKDIFREVVKLGKIDIEYR